MAVFPLSSLSSASGSLEGEVEVSVCWLILWYTAVVSIRELALSQTVQEVGNERASLTDVCEPGQTFSR